MSEYTPPAHAARLTGFETLIPDLAAPPEAELVPRFGGRSDRHASAMAELITNLDLHTVASHYAHQLERAGWERRSGEEHGSQAWSTWFKGIDDVSGRHIILFRAVPAGQPNRYFIKRIVGLPGESVAVRNEAVFINGRRLRESYVHVPAMYFFPPRRVPSGDYFVLGDNRNNSFDSSKWQTPWLPRRDILGRVFTWRK